MDIKNDTHKKKYFMCEKKREKANTNKIIKKYKQGKSVVFCKVLLIIS